MNKNTIRNLTIIILTIMRGSVAETTTVGTTNGAVGNLVDSEDGITSLGEMVATEWLDLAACNSTNCTKEPGNRGLISQCDVESAICSTYYTTSTARTGGLSWVLTARCPSARTQCGKTRRLFYAGGGCRAISSGSTDPITGVNPSYSSCSELTLAASYPVAPSAGNFVNAGGGHRCLWYHPGAACSVKYAVILTCCSYIRFDDVGS
jgi:hypothetical protein